MEDPLKIKRTELADFLARMAEKSESVYWLSSPDFKTIEYISPAYEKIWGRSPDILYAQPEEWISYLHVEDRAHHHPIHDMAERIIELGPLARYEEDYRIVRPDGQIRWIADRGFPVYDAEGECYAVTGVAIDITNTVEQHEKFRNVVTQVVHDIRSPLAAMQMILPSCNILPENLRRTLNQLAMRITDISNNLFNQFNKKRNTELHFNQMVVPTLISTVLLDILAEKKYEYSHFSIDFLPKISEAAYFVFIDINVPAFKRTLSNLINNAVEALPDQKGTIIVHLDVMDDKLKMIIEDNGSGMSDFIKNKILNNISVTAGKVTGQGIGFSQIRETVANYQGVLGIESVIGQWTKISLTFPITDRPDWLADKIELKPDNLIIILDDDPCIHGAWDARLERAAPKIDRLYFDKAEEVIEFVNTLSLKQKSKIFLLTDYELLKQKFNGLDVIQQTQIGESIMVTSHYANPIVLKRAFESQTKILPKPLAAEIPIQLYEEVQLTMEF